MKKYIFTKSHPKDVKNRYISILFPYLQFFNINHTIGLLNLSNPLIINIPFIVREL